jgi:hypothetical protein
MTTHIPSRLFSKLSHKDQVRFALFCDYQLKSKWSRSIKVKKAIKLVELWLEDKATTEDCQAFLDSERNMRQYPYSIPTIARYHVSAEYAAGASDYVLAAFVYDYKQKDIMRAQREYLNELLYVDDIFEKIVLNG